MYVPPFLMERWQSRYEHAVDFNLSESGVHPFGLGEILELTDLDLTHVRLGYTQSDGTAELKARVAELYRGASPANIVVTTGGAEANMLAAWKLVSSGDRVVIVQPAYGQIGGLVRALGAEVVDLPLYERLGWQPEPGAADALITPGTRLVVVTNPSNPTGSILSVPARKEIIGAAERSGAWILADEVYAGAELSGGSTSSFWGDCERVVATNSLSKAYGLPGLRLGWLVVPQAEHEAYWARKDYTTIAPSALSDAIATAALAPDVRRLILERTHRILTANLGRLTQALDESAGLFEYTRPRAGAICLVRYRPKINSSELAERLRCEESVLVVPGDHFSLDGYLRIGYGIPGEQLEPALGRLSAAVARFEDAPAELTLP